MWSSNDGGGGTGGGFVTSPNQFNSPAGGDKAGARVKRSTNLVPVTIRQLHASTDEALRIEDVEVSVVSIVGLVTHVEQTTTKLSFTIDDQTGSIETINYVGADNESGSGKQTLLQEGTYGRVVGSLRTQKGGSGGRYLIIYKCTPVLDINEITCHGLEVLQVASKLKRLKEQEALRTGVGGGRNTLNTSTSTTSMIGSLNDTNTSAGNNAAMGGLTANQSMVLRCIQSVKGDEGAHVAQVVQNLKNKLSEKEIRNLIEYLSGEGHIYSTVDDDHYRSTDW